MTPEETLIKAADDLATHGHAKGTFYNPSGAQSWETASACALGAIARVTGYASKGQGIVRDEIFTSEAVHKLAATIREKGGKYANLGDNYCTVTGYNDDDHTTAEDVILTMKEAAHG